MTPTRVDSSQQIWCGFLSLTQFATTTSILGCVVQSYDDFTSVWLQFTYMTYMTVATRGITDNEIHVLGISIRGVHHYYTKSEGYWVRLRNPRQICWLESTRAGIIKYCSDCVGISIWVHSYENSWSYDCLKMVYRFTNSFSIWYTILEFTFNFQKKVGQKILENHWYPDDNSNISLNPNFKSF